MRHLRYLVLSLAALPAIAIAATPPVLGTWKDAAGNVQQTIGTTCLNADNTPCTSGGGSGGTPVAATATTTSVTGSASAVTLLAANTNRTGASITNDSAAILYILLGTGTVSATNYTYAIDAKSTVPGVVEIPADWHGIITGIWASATGAARVTERSQ
jgi:hypothetical protein